jgi:hypothetical protein
MKTKLSDVIGKRGGSLNFTISWDMLDTDNPVIGYNFEIIQNTECGKYGSCFDEESDVQTFLEFAELHDCFNKKMLFAVQKLFHQYEIERVKGRLHED